MAQNLSETVNNLSNNLNLESGNVAKKIENAKDNIYDFLMGDGKALQEKGSASAFWALVLISTFVLLLI